MKPDDVSQEAWDAADLVFEFSIHNTVDYNKYRTNIARAIMAAKAEERKSIADYLMESAGTDMEMRSYARYWAEEIRSRT